VSDLKGAGPQIKTAARKVMTYAQPCQNDSQRREAGENAVAGSNTSAKLVEKQPTQFSLWNS
jgi:hypothetical protein